MNFIKNAYIKNRIRYNNIMKKVISDYSNFQIYTAYALTWTSVFLCFIVGKKIIFYKHKSEIDELYRKLSEKMIEILIKSKNIINFNENDHVDAKKEENEILSFLEKNSIKETNDHDNIQKIITILNFLSKKLNYETENDNNHLKLKDVKFYLIDQRKFDKDELNKILNIKLKNIVVTDKISEYNYETIMLYYIFKYFQSSILENYLLRQDKIIKDFFLQLSNNLFSSFDKSSYLYNLNNFIKLKNSNDSHKNYESIESVIDAYLHYKNKMKYHPFECNSIIEKLNQDLKNSKKSKEIIESVKTQTDNLLNEYEYRSVELSLITLKSMGYEINDIKNVTRAIYLCFNSSQFRDLFVNISDKIIFEETLLRFYMGYNVKLIDESISKENLSEMIKILKNSSKRLKINNEHS